MPVSERRNQPATQSPSKLEQQLERLVFLLSRRMRHHFDEQVEAFDLTPAEAGALRWLGEAAPMRELAEHMHCDASYITGIADNLEARGLVERQLNPNDRRIKQLVLTDAGRELRREFHTRLVASSPVVARLNQQEKRTLTELLLKIVGD